LIDPLIVGHIDLGHVPRHARADGHHVPVDKSVVGALVGQRVNIIPNADPDSRHGASAEQSPNPGTTTRLGRMIRLRVGKLVFLDVIRFHTLDDVLMVDFYG
jgi:hypothetical protein